MRKHTHSVTALESDLTTDFLSRTDILAIVEWGAGSRVVKSLGCGARGPGFESRLRRKCWAVME